MNKAETRQTTKACKRAQDLVGQTHENWSFIEVAYIVLHNHRSWCVLGVCVCGTRRFFRVGTHTRSASCGCLTKEGSHSSGAEMVKRRRSDLSYYVYELARKRVDVKTGKTPFLITPEDIQVASRCPILGLTFQRGTVNPVLTTLNPTLGYVQGNLLVISEQAQALRLGGALTYLKWVRASGITEDFKLLRDALLEGSLPKEIRGEPLQELMPHVPEEGETFFCTKTKRTYRISKVRDNKASFCGGRVVPLHKLEEKYIRVEPVQMAPEPALVLDLEQAEALIRKALNNLSNPFETSGNMPAEVEAIWFEIAVRGWTKENLKQYRQTVQALVLDFLGDKLPFSQLSYEALGVFSVRTVRVFARMKIETVAGLLDLTPSRLKAERNFGRKCLAEVTQVLKFYGLSLMPDLKGELLRR